MRSARAVQRVLTAAVSIGLFLAACSADVAVYDPTIERNEPLAEDDFFGSGSVLLDGGSIAGRGEDQPGLRTRIPGFVAPEFDPSLAALPQLEPRQRGTVTMLGPETGTSVESIEFALTAFTNATGIRVDYISSPDADRLLEELIAEGEPPDIAIIERPSRIVTLAQRGELIPLPRVVQNQVEVGYDTLWRQLVTVEGRMFAVPQAGSVKSLVWYSPQVFLDNGYTPPQTFADLERLVVRIRSDELTPWCIGIGSGASSGWPFIDWIEDFTLRFEGPEFYDRWVAHEIPFNDPEVVAVIEQVAAMWFEAGNVNGGRSSIASTSWMDAAIDHMNGECVLHLQADFIAGTYRDAGAVIGASGDINAFYLPTVNDDFGQVVLGAGNFAAALSDDQATLSLMAYIAAPDFAEARILSRKGNFLSAHQLHNTGLYRDQIDRDLASILVSADPFRFDGSDQMPETVKSELLRSGTVFVGGTTGVFDFADEVEASWD